jgi:hypothetical protein
MLTSNSDIRVLHLATGTVGGAGLAARRLNSALIAAGVDSTFCSPARYGYSPQSGEIDFKIPVISRLWGGVYTLIQKNFHTITFFSLFSARVLRTRKLDIIARNKDTILQFHNWYNLVSQRQIIKLATSGYSVVVTMHDQRFFTGGCHYAIDCNRFVTNCRNCPRLPFAFRIFPQVNLYRTNKLIRKKHPNIYFVAPSNWLKNEAEKSKSLRNQEVLHISNTLGKEISSGDIPTSKVRVNPNRIAIGLAGMDPNHYLKGGSILKELIKEIEQKFLPIELIYLNQIKSNSNASEEFWSRIDFMLSLSQADNSPNVIHEAKAAGVPVISTSVGGIPELLVKGIDFEVPHNISGSALAQEILRISKTTTDSINLVPANNAFIEYIQHSIQDYINLYSRIKDKIN